MSRLYTHNQRHRKTTHIIRKIWGTENLSHLLGKIYHCTPHARFALIIASVFTIILSVLGLRFLFGPHPTIDRDPELLRITNGTYAYEGKIPSVQMTTAFGVSND